jgi:RimJ/RimL family protein N-acetyltransferase
MQEVDSPPAGTPPTLRFEPPVTLTGRYVVLVPLEIGHLKDLSRAGEDARIWEFMVVRPGTTLTSMRANIENLLQRQGERTDLAFTVLERGSMTPIGMTRFLEIERADRTVEVGGTWFDPRYWASPVNTESKRLMLGRAFDTEGVLRVQFKTDLRNLRSQRAIERLGAVREGVLRDHRIVWDGRIRSSVVYSILLSEWPQVRKRLDGFLSHRGKSGGSFLAERRDALGQLGTPRGLDRASALERELSLEGLGIGAQHEALDPTKRERGPRRQLLRARLRPGDQLVGGDDLVDQTEFLRPLGVHPGLREQQLLGQADPQVVGKQVRETPIRYSSETRKGGDQRRLRDGDPPVGRQGQRETSPGGHPGEGGDHRLRHRHDLPDRRLLNSCELVE